MRSELGKECRKLFKKMMTTVFPEYCEDKGQIVPQGWYVWSRQHPRNIRLHIGFVIHHSQDMFTVEAGWSFDGKLLPCLSRAEDFLSNPSHVRAAEIWLGKDYWWPLVLRPKEFERALLYKDDPIEQCLPLVSPAIWDAGEKLKDYVIPIFEQVVQKHGKETF
jgi:hypothetical protein